MPSVDPRPRQSVVARRLRAVASLTLLCWLGAAAAQQLEVIELRHRLADDVMPALQSLLEPGGVLTGTDSTLFVRTSPSNLEQIRQALAVLDRRPRQLLLSVGQGTVATVREAEVRGTASIGSGDVQVGVNRPPGTEPGATVTARASTQHADLHDVSSVRALEGTETFIAVGQSVPVTTTQVTSGWSGTTTVHTTEYRDASTGFYATARVSGDVVSLEISPRRQRFSGPSAQRSLDTAGITTWVSGRLGEWLPVGGAVQSGSTVGSGLLAAGGSSLSSGYTVWVKVEEVQ